MAGVRQGEEIRFEKGGHTALVMSKDFFNASGMAVVCPVVASAPADGVQEVADTVQSLFDYYPFSIG